MEPETKKLATPGGILFDIALSVVFFLAFTFKVIPPHVPAYDPFWIYSFSAFTSLVLTGVFYFAVAYLRVTWVDQILREKK